MFQYLPTTGNTARKHKQTCYKRGNKLSNNSKKIVNNEQHVTKKKQKFIGCSKWNFLKDESLSLSLGAVVIFFTAII